MADAGYGKQHMTRLTETLDADRRLAKGGRPRIYSVKITAQAEFDMRFESFATIRSARPADTDGQPSVTTAARPGDSTAARKVFVVHGHDHGFKNTVARFIEQLGLEAIILHERPDGGRTVIEKFEQESGVAFAVVLATPDDLAESAKNLAKEDKIGVSKEQLEARARQNVVFELGYFIGKLRRAHVALVTQSGVKLPSDLIGIVYIDRSEWQKRLYDALSDTGFEFSQTATRAAFAIHG